MEQTNQNVVEDVEVTETTETEKKGFMGAVKDMLHKHKVEETTELQEVKKSKRDFKSIGKKVVKTTLVFGAGVVTTLVVQKLTGAEVDVDEIKENVEEVAEQVLTNQGE